MIYERRSQKLASRAVYRKRLIQSGVAGFVMVVISLAVGMAGYAWFEGLGWIDSFVNAAMILSGMGPLHNPDSTGGKLFAGIYALYSGFAVLVIAALTFAPAIHRMLHRFHLQADDGQDQGEGDEAPRPRKDAARGKRRR
ncbi:MAG TPA: hypothetical protein VH040_14665 [Usitatibacter sp.]|jgi:hypothetical protein|nr:hypothetical protein [Usitatibacter sp.]